MEAALMVVHAPQIRVSVHLFQREPQLLAGPGRKEDPRALVGRGRLPSGPPPPRTPSGIPPRSCPGEPSSGPRTSPAHRVLRRCRLPRGCSPAPVGPGPASRPRARPEGRRPLPRPVHRAPRARPAGRTAGPGRRSTASWARRRRPTGIRSRAVCSTRCATRPPAAPARSRCSG